MAEMANPDANGSWNDMNLRVAKEYVELMHSLPQDTFIIRCANSDCTHTLVGNIREKITTIKEVRNNWHGVEVPGFKGINGTPQAVVCSDCYSLSKEDGLVFKNGLICNSPVAEWTVNVPAVICVTVKASTLEEAKKIAWDQVHTRFPADKTKNQDVYPQWYDASARWYFSRKNEDSDFPF